MRRSFFVGSWKANKTLEEAKQYFKDFQNVSSTFMHETVLCPSYIHMETAMNMMPATVKLGAQDVSQYPSGPYTGEISASMLASMGVKYCIVGHVDRRKDGETDEQINKKIKQLIAAGISPIVCFGETMVDYENNMTQMVIDNQMKICLAGVTDISKLILCYQPIWSVGTGYYTAGDYTNIIADYMRKHIVKITGNPMSANTTILYGGQITVGNVREYMDQPEIDGVMFAVAAMDVNDFAAVVTSKFTIKKYSQ